MPSNSSGNRFSGRKGGAETLPSPQIGAAYAMRWTLLPNVARIFLGRDADLVAQEWKDGVSIGFAAAGRLRVMHHMCSLIGR
jgi:hypothetical protein